MQIDNLLNEKNWPEDSKLSFFDKYLQTITACVRFISIIDA